MHMSSSLYIELYITWAFMYGASLCRSPTQPRHYRARTSRGGFHPTVVIQGKVGHRIAGLTMAAGERPRFAHIYINDPEEARTSDSTASIQIGYMKFRSGELDSPGKRQSLHCSLHFHHDRSSRCNRYVNDFQTAYEKAKAGESEANQLVITADARPRGEHERRYNTDTGMREISVLLHDDTPGNRDLVLQPRQGNVAIRYLHETHRSYDSLHWTLSFPEGERLCLSPWLINT
eukprot:scaffold172259_cov19-Prasinocladus_malaysianus.AAC.1